MRVFDKKSFIEDMEYLGITEEKVRNGWANVVDGTEVKEFWIGWVEEIDGMEVRIEYIDDDLGENVYKANGYLIKEEWTKEI